MNQSLHNISRSNARPLRALTLVLLFALVTSTHAQTGAEILKGKEITESALIDALTPDDSLPPGVRTRSIKLGGTSSGTASGSAANREAAAKPRSKDVLITFETNSAQLSDEGKASLDVVARAFNNEKLATLSFAIEGHADPRGSADENFRLSQARADSVRNYLVAAKGVNPDRLKAIGKGDRELMNTRSVAAPENRRVTFVTSQ
jgi:OmpA-OmpF porin, OOP family